MTTNPQIDFENIHLKDDDELKNLGFGFWNSNPVVGTLWLIPKKWYALIPDGLLIVTIDGTTELFKAGVTDDSSWSGYLSYGIYKAKPPKLLSEGEITPRQL